MKVQHSLEERRLSIGLLLEIYNSTAIDCDGVRWVRCASCGHIGPEGDFVSYGGEGAKRNSGTCMACSMPHLVEIRSGKMVRKELEQNGITVLDQ